MAMSAIDHQNVGKASEFVERRFDTLLGPGRQVSPSDIAAEQGISGEDGTELLEPVTDAALGMKRRGQGLNRQS